MRRRLRTGSFETAPETGVDSHVPRPKATKENVKLDPRGTLGPETVCEVTDGSVVPVVTAPVPVFVSVHRKPVLSAPPSGRAQLKVAVEFAGMRRLSTAHVRPSAGLRVSAVKVA
jgi:hypothetical protein